MGTVSDRAGLATGRHAAEPLAPNEAARDAPRAPMLRRLPEPRHEKLSALGFDGGPDPALLAGLGRIAALPWVESVLALPDLHQKDDMEVPSSLAITTSGAIVPEFTSVAINDGMGLVVTGLGAREMSRERVAQFLLRANAHSAAHLLDVNRYSLATDDLPWALLEGGRTAIERYGLDPEVLDHMEWGGHLAVPEGVGPWQAAVPCGLLRTRLGCSEMGLNFGGNHFLELQVVDRVLDVRTAARWGLARDQVVVMYHLGPGPFSGTLLHFFSRRQKLSRLRAPAFLLAKLLFHYVRRHGQGTLGRKWRLHFRRNRYTPFAPHSPEGLLMRQALALATNFGFVYRLATVAAIRDALHETLSPRIEARLLCDVSHNGITEEPWDGGTAWIARHNACRLDRGGPAIVAGSHDVPSYLGRGAVDAPRELHSYDHGAGHLIEAARSAGHLEPAGGTTIRLRATRGRRARVRSLDEVPVRTSRPIDGLMSCFERHGVLYPVVRLRPVGTLKN